MKTTIKNLAFTIAVLLFGTQTNAQSTDIDNPTHITSNTLEGMTNPDEKTAFYYSICVKPGTLKVTADLTSEYGGSMVYFHFLNDGFKEIATNDFKGEEHKNRTVREFRFAKAQRLILKLTFINLTTDSKFTFDGAINTNADCGNTNQSSNPKGFPASSQPTNTPNSTPSPNTDNPQTNANPTYSQPANNTIIPPTTNINTNPKQSQNGMREVAKYINMGNRPNTTTKTILKQLTNDGSKIGIYQLEIAREVPINF